MNRLRRIWKRTRVVMAVVIPIGLFVLLGLALGWIFILHLEVMSLEDAWFATLNSSANETAANYWDYLDGKSGAKAAIASLETFLAALPSPPKDPKGIEAITTLGEFREELCSWHAFGRARLLMLQQSSASSRNLASERLPETLMYWRLYRECLSNGKGMYSPNVPGSPDDELNLLLQATRSLDVQRTF